MKETILAIDDERMNREFYCGLLKDKGYNVLQAANGEDAADDIDSYVFIIRDITSNAAILFDWNESQELFKLEQ